jgi:hypothetical protein
MKIKIVEVSPNNKQVGEYRVDWNYAIIKNGVIKSMSYLPIADFFSQSKEPIKRDIDITFDLSKNFNNEYYKYRLLIKFPKDALGKELEDIHFFTNDFSCIDYNLIKLWKWITKEKDWFWKMILQAFVGGLIGFGIGYFSAAKKCPSTDNTSNKIEQRH